MHRDFTEPTSVTALVQAHTSSATHEGAAVEELVTTAIRAAFEHSALVDAALSQSEDSLPVAERELVVEQAVSVAKEVLTSESVTIQFGLSVGLQDDSGRVIQVPVGSGVTVDQFLESISTSIDGLSLPLESYGREWFLIHGEEPLHNLSSRRRAHTQGQADGRLLSEAGVRPSEIFSVRLAPLPQPERRAAGRATRDAGELPHFDSVAEFHAYVFEAKLTVAHLRAIAESLGINISGGYKKADLADRIAEVILGVDLDFPLDNARILPTSAGVTAAIGTVAATEVAGWHASFRERLFGVNVRQYLGGQVAQSQVAQSREELNSEPHAFVAFNSGITILADRFYMLQRGANRAEMRVEGARVVNGGQTVLAISQACSENSEVGNSVHVVVRIVSQS
ncbi:AIPR family protein [Micromonospora sp. NPDC018662]|uniref:AIPR family protein n=1 Tax=Micromonospora sp. NPDC018662 TaxID=3364238 RepID=UPI00378E1925